MSSVTHFIRKNLDYVAPLLLSSPRMYLWGERNILCTEKFEQARLLLKFRVNGFIILCVMINEILKIEDLFVANSSSSLILKGVNLSVKRGEIHAILGSNGTGKTTLGYTIIGSPRYKVIKGKILFQGKDITRLSITERARLGITMAFQHPADFEGIKVRDYLKISKKYSRDNLSPETALKMVGLNPDVFLNRTLDSSLSGGERKRIELAAVFLMRPEIAILDEPDSGIDLMSISDIANVVRTLNKMGTTIILITHREELALMADRSSHLCGGIILRSGPVREIVDIYLKNCKICDHVNRPEVNHAGV